MMKAQAGKITALGMLCALACGDFVFPFFFPFWVVLLGKKWIFPAYFSNAFRTLWTFRIKRHKDSDFSIIFCAP